MKRVECVCMVGKLLTPKGTQNFWDTGRSITPVQLAEILGLQHSIFALTGKQRRMAIDKLYEKVTEMCNQVNVWPKGTAALAADGRILVTEPWFEEKESNPKGDKGGE